MGDMSLSYVGHLYVLGIAARRHAFPHEFWLKPAEIGSFHSFSCSILPVMVAIYGEECQENQVRVLGTLGLLGVATPPQTQPLPKAIARSV
jgi:hypothetical protein